jgi:hypothetical protein
VRTMQPAGPTFLSDFFVALAFVDKVVEAAHGRKVLNLIMSSKPNKSLNCNMQVLNS